MSANAMTHQRPRSELLARFDDKPRPGYRPWCYRTPEDLAAKMQRPTRMTAEAWRATLKDRMSRTNDVFVLEALRMALAATDAAEVQPVPKRGTKRRRAA